MNTEKPVPRYFRLLEKGEKRSENDWWSTSPNNFKQIKDFDGLLVEHDYVFREVTVDPWIEYAQQKPTKEDFEPTGFLETLDSGQPFHWEYETPDDLQLDSYTTHWRRITPPTPAKPKSVTIRVSTSSGYPRTEGDMDSNSST